MKTQARPDFSFMLLATMHLLAVGAVFGSGYQLALRRAARLSSHQTLVDTAIAADIWVPFWDWSILIYVSINIVYIAAFYLSRDESELNQLSKRLLAVQLAACICFWLFPSHMLRMHPLVSSPWAHVYTWLSLFDQPFNLMPSLHVSVAVVLWSHLQRRYKGFRRILCHVWTLAVVASALTTWQHNLLDIPAGFVLGVLSLLAIKNPAK
jgi:membrane-associated phospholipid phosphatase